MITAYHPLNSIEAHSVKIFLIGEGIEARVTGDYLQGAMGELPALGTLQVQVPEADARRARCPPWRAKRRRVVPGSREATRDTRRAEGAKGDPKGASERGVQSYGRPVCSRNELAMLWRNAG